MTQQTISLIRVLQYTGDANWVAATIAHHTIKGSYIVHSGGTIREALLGDPFELISSPALAAAPNGFGLRAQLSDRQYEGLRTLLDGGSKSATHEDAVKEVQRLKALDGVNNGKPTWDAWVDNEMNGLRHLVASGQMDPGTADALKAQLDRAREFANMP